MPHRILVVEKPLLRPDFGVCNLLIPTEDFKVDQLFWDSLVPEQLLSSKAHLIIFEAYAALAEAMELFGWLRTHPLPAPSLAVLPPNADEATLKTTTEVVDDFVIWPIRRQEVSYRLRRMLGPAPSDPEALRWRLNEEFGLAQIAGTDSAFVQVIEKIPLIAASDAPVLISGETGTGKELCARAIHHLSPRRSNAFIPMDCGALPENLMENELFGHIRGAYTDAHANQKGLVGMADGGSLFLDEVDSLSLPAQAKLLRFLEEQTYRALGAEEFSRADVRVIAATNRDLETCLLEKQFRRDLYYRLNVLHVHLPPLRERRADIALLARHFLDSLVPAPGAPHKFPSPAVLRKLEGHHWPGNVRELFNVLRRAVVFSRGVEIMPGDVTFRSSADEIETPRGSFRHARAQAIQKFEKAYVEELLSKHHGNITRAAVEASKDRRAFGRLVRKYEIDRMNFQVPGRS
jgi:two-component system response regulator GlrR